jgi:hypothetical protein
MVDLPHYESEADTKGKRITQAVTSENAQDIMAQINAMI